MNNLVKLAPAILLSVFCRSRAFVRVFLIYRQILKKDGVYEVDLGFKQVMGQNGKMSTQLTLVGCTAIHRKVLDWAKITA